jgi:fused signal recognition particle receptor
MAGFFKKLFKQITNQAEVDWDELEANLIAADLGAKLSTGIVDELYDLGARGILVTAIHASRL